MEQLYVFLIEWDIPIYFVGGLVWLISLYQFWQANRRVQRSVFSLERERAQQARGNALLFLTAATAVVGLVLYVNLSIAPSLPPELLRPPTPTPNVFATPLSSPTPLGGNDVLGTPRPRVTPNLVPTVTLLPGLATAPPATPLPPEGEGGSVEVAPPGQPPVAIPEGGGCTPAVNIAQPAANTAVFGTVEFIGTASGAQFGFYRLELRGETTGNAWATLLDDTFTAVENGTLGAANLGNLPNGEYEVRLSVLSASNQPVGQCTIRLVVSNG